MLLAGDIGGTKVNLAVFTRQMGPRQPLAETRFRSEQFPDLGAIIQVYLDTHPDFEIQQASFGVAGPVVEGQARVTNLNWMIEAEELQARFDFQRVDLLNDLESIANAVPVLQADDLHPINRGNPRPGGAIAVIAPGTGLGEAFLTWNGDCYRAHPSEGGHTDFAPTSALESRMLEYLQGQIEHVSYERVCSGMGIPNIYAALKHLKVAEEPLWLKEKLVEAADPTPIIVSAALDDRRRSELCVATLDTFVSVLGSEAANMALKVLATGGVYLGGGIPPKIRSKLEDGTFMAAFLRKGRLSSLLSEMPVNVILNEQAALLGAASFGLSR